MDGSFVPMLGSLRVTEELMWVWVLGGEFVCNSSRFLHARLE